MLTVSWFGSESQFDFLLNEHKLNQVIFPVILAVRCEGSCPRLKWSTLAQVFLCGWRGQHSVVHHSDALWCALGVEAEPPGAARGGKRRRLRWVPRQTWSQSLGWMGGWKTGDIQPSLHKTEQPGCIGEGGHWGRRCGKWGWHQMTVIWLKKKKMVERDRCGDWRGRERQEVQISFPGCGLQSCLNLGITSGASDAGSCLRGCNLNALVCDLDIGVLKAPVDNSHMQPAWEYLISGDKG